MILSYIIFGVSYHKVKMSILWAWNSGNQNDSLTWLLMVIRHNCQQTKFPDIRYLKDI